MQFPYLRDLLSKIKGRGGKVIHINRDPRYDDVRKNESWIQKSAAEGLEDII